MCGMQSTAHQRTWQCTMALRAPMKLQVSRCVNLRLTIASLSQEPSELSSGTTPFFIVIIQKWAKSLQPKETSTE